jgi:hypothetical protein
MNSRKPHITLSNRDPWANFVLSLHLLLQADQLTLKVLGEIIGVRHEMSVKSINTFSDQK